MKVILDVDPGIDDAMAMGMILSRKDIEILAITCVVGNVGVDQATKNALKVVEAFDRKDVRVYKGASSAIVGTDVDGTYYHGKDGLADILPNEVDMAPLQAEHAVSAINRLVRDHRGEVTLITLGPLTNIALAYRLNASLSEDLKEIVIMGGNYKGEGNVTFSAEFNFFVDPIAAHIVLEDFKCPKFLVTWELSKQHFLSLEDIQQYCNYDSDKSRFMKRIFEEKGLTKNACGYCDAVAVAVATNREIVLDTFFKYATVHIESSSAKGMVSIQWNTHYSQTYCDMKSPNVIIVEKIDVALFCKLVLDSTR